MDRQPRFLHELEQYWACLSAQCHSTEGHVRERLKAKAEAITTGSLVSLDITQALIRQQ
jgi:hypothetical protein